MEETIQLGDISILVMRRSIKHVHLSVLPPDGRVTMSAPITTRLDVARAYAISKINWIREQRGKFEDQARETPRQFVSRETHYLWGRRYLLTVVQKDSKPHVSLDHRRISLTVRPDSDLSRRAQVIHEWHKSLLHEVVPSLISKWEAKLKVNVSGYFLQRMKTKWGSCNPKDRHIRLNTELVKKPEICLSTSSSMKWLTWSNQRTTTDTSRFLTTFFPAGEKLAPNSIIFPSVRRHGLRNIRQGARRTSVSDRSQVFRP